MDYKLQSSGLQYKRFLAFPWILTVTWPMDIVSVNLTLDNITLLSTCPVLLFLSPSQDNGEYPLVMSGLYWKKFRSHFCEFVSVLISQCQFSVIFDNYLLNTLISLLTELSASHMRAFRHTCTLAGNSINTDPHCLSNGGVGYSWVKLFVMLSLHVAVKLLSALANVALNLSISVENSQKLCEVELAKMSSKRASPRLDKIQKKITEVSQWLSERSVVPVSCSPVFIISSFYFVGGCVNVPIFNHMFFLLRYTTAQMF